MHSSAAVGMCR